MQLCTQSSVPRAAIQPVASSSCVRAGFSRIPGSVYEASLAVPRRARDSWLLVSVRSHHLSRLAKPCPSWQTMDCATLMRAAAEFLYARDVRALRVTAPAAQAHSILIHSEN